MCPLIQTRPLRRTDYDSQVQDVRDGDYLDALGAVLVSKRKRETGVTTPMVGNRYAHRPSVIAAQNKIVDLFLVGSGPFAIRIVRNTSGRPFTSSIVFTDFSTAITNIVLGTTEAGWAFVASVANGAVRIQPNNPEMLYYDYRVEVVLGSINVVTFQESYDASVAGALKPFSGMQFVSKLFLFSASRFRRVRQIVIDNIETGLGDVRVFSPDHGLVEGQEVYCAGFVTLPEANGYYIVQVISPQVFRLRAAVVGTGFYTPGQGTISANVRTVGELGVAQKNSTGTWDYISLGRAKNFNWKRNKRVNIHIENSVGRTRLYFSGDDNPYRRIELKGLTENSMFLKSGYSYDALSDQIRSQLTTTSAEVTNSQVNNSGGAVSSGNWRFTIRGGTQDQNTAPWGKLSGPVNIFNSDTLGPVVDILGDDEGIITSKAILLTISNVNTDLYKFIEIGAINYLSLGIDPVVATRISVVPGQTEYEYLFTGNEIDTSALDAVSINVEPKVIEKCVAQAFVDNRGFLGNLTYFGDTTELGGVIANAKYKLRTESIALRSVVISSRKT